MATTTNIGLTKPAGTDKALVSVLNANSDIIDSAAGGLMDAIAIVANGNTHAAISAGQYVYVHNHGTLAEGLYTANSAIAANATLSTSNLTADASGGLNALNSNIATINGKIDVAAYTGDINNIGHGTYYCTKSQCTNTPNATNTAWIVKSDADTIGNNKFGYQYAVGYDSPTEVYTRRAWGTWGNWEKLALESSITVQTDTIAGGNRVKMGNMRCLSFRNNGEITADGVSLGETALSNVTTPCVYYNGTSNVDGLLYILGNKVYVTNLTVNQVSATYIRGQIVYFV